MTTRPERITQLLQPLQPSLLEIHDDSHQHAGHNDAAKAGGTHLRIEISAPQLVGKSRVQQHRMVQDLLKSEFETGLHALQIKVI
jgi:BolA protein